MLGWPKKYKLAHAFLWEYSDKRVKLAQLLGQLGVFLTWALVSSTWSVNFFITGTSACRTSPVSVLDSAPLSTTTPQSRSTVIARRTDASQLTHAARPLSASQPFSASSGR